LGGYLDSASDVAISVFLLIATLYFILLFMQAIAMKLLTMLNGIQCCASCLTRIINITSTKRARAPVISSKRGGRSNVATATSSNSNAVAASSFHRSNSGRVVLTTNPRQIISAAPTTAST
jgi:hypothetical protein